MVFLKKIIPIWMMLLAVLLCGCSSEEPDDLYGFTIRYGNICKTKLKVSEFIEYENDGEKAYARFFDTEAGTLMLTLREQAQTRRICSCSVTGEKREQNLEELFVNVCRVFTTLTAEECVSAAEKCVNGDYAYGSYVFSFDENEYAACFHVDNTRFSGSS